MNEMDILLNFAIIKYFKFYLAVIILVIFNDLQTGSHSSFTPISDMLTATRKSCTIASNLSGSS